MVSEFHSQNPLRPIEQVHFEITQNSGRNENTEIEISSSPITATPTRKKLVYYNRPLQLMLGKWTSFLLVSRASKTLPHDAQKCIEAIVFDTVHPL